MELVAQEVGMMMRSFMEETAVTEQVQLAVLALAVQHLFLGVTAPLVATRLHQEALMAMQI